MQHLFRGLGRRLGRGLGRRQHSRRCDRHADCLAGVEAGKVVTITCNDDIRTVERGLCTGVKVRVMRNETDEPNLIVAVGDARYVLDRRIAHRIKVSKI
jgi:Fe2+ transport system protein FeoA